MCVCVYRGIQLEEGGAEGEVPMSPQTAVLLHCGRSNHPIWRNEVHTLYYLHCLCFLIHLHSSHSSVKPQTKPQRENLRMSCESPKVYVTVGESCVDEWEKNLKSKCTNLQETNLTSVTAAKGETPNEGVITYSLSNVYIFLNFNLFK